MFHASGYADAGYAIGLSVLFLYGVSLVLRRRRLERSVNLLEEDRTSEDPVGP